MPIRVKITVLPRTPDPTTTPNLNGTHTLSSFPTPALCDDGDDAATPFLAPQSLDSLPCSRYENHRAIPREPWMHRRSRLPRRRSDPQPTTVASKYFHHRVIRIQAGGFHRAYAPKTIPPDPPTSMLTPANPGVAPLQPLVRPQLLPLVAFQTSLGALLQSFCRFVIALSAAGSTSMSVIEGGAISGVGRGCIEGNKGLEWYDPVGGTTTSVQRRKTGHLVYVTSWQTGTFKEGQSTDPVSYPRPKIDLRIGRVLQEACVSERLNVGEIEHIGRGNVELHAEMGGGDEGCGQRGREIGNGVDGLEVDLHRTVEAVAAIGMPLGVATKRLYRSEINVP
ncbi:hypothetical protein BJ742DRAFT_769602 [Cladochytrium replicatum]|nr:hypothetical protein BJ742DRAFT_769602 [Cladochytrium replicatum]